MRLLVAAAVLVVPAAASADDWFVAPGGTGDGSTAAPSGGTQAACAVDAPGDVVTVAPGTSTQAVQTVRPGLDGAPITVRGAAGAIAAATGRVLTITHPNHVFEQRVLDGEYGPDDAV